MNESTAKLISWVFHPIFIPFFGILIILYSFPFHYQYIPDKLWNITIITLFLMTMLFPAMLILILKKLDMVDDLDISDKKQRILPYLIFFFFYLISFLTFKPKPISSIVFMEDPLIATVLLGATISLGISFFANNFLKISAHTNACANLFAFCCLLSRYTQKNLFIVIVVTLIIVGLVGSSRILLKAHTTKEVYYGILCGIFGQILAFGLYFSDVYKA